MRFKVHAAPDPIEDGTYDVVVIDSRVTKSPRRNTPQIYIRCRIKTPQGERTVAAYLYLTERSIYRTAQQLEVLRFKTPEIDGYLEFDALDAGEESPIAGARCRARVQTDEGYGTRVVEFLPELSAGDAEQEEGGA